MKSERTENSLEVANSSSKVLKSDENLFCFIKNQLEHDFQPS